MAVLGSGPKVTWRGHLKWAIWPRHQAMSAAASRRPSAPGFRVTKACGVSPQVSSGRATTAASRTSGWRYSTSSTSSELMFSPPEMMMSFARSLISTYPSGWSTARSPVWNQSPAKAAPLAAGLAR